MKPAAGVIPTQPTMIAVAAPIARDILLFALAGGLPPLDAYPPGQRDAVVEMRAKLRLDTPEPPKSARVRA